MTVQSWIAILLKFSQLFRAGGCAKMRFACIFLNIFDAPHNNMLRNLILRVFSSLKIGRLFRSLWVPKMGGGVKKFPTKTMHLFYGNYKWTGFRFYQYK